MRPFRTAVAVLLAVLVTLPASAGRRRAVGSAGPVNADAMGFGQLSGATIAGTVLSVSGTVVRLETGGAPAIAIEARDAKIVAHDQMPRTVAEIVAGARITAFVEDPPAGGGPLPAKVIMVESRPDLLIAGTIESINLAAQTFTVIGITIGVDGDTRYDTAFPTFAPVDDLGDLSVGNLVKVDVDVAGAKLVADRVHVADAVARVPEMLRGTVKSISDASWVITRNDGGDVAVTVNSRTKIAGEPGVGDEVQVIAERDSAGGWVALLIVRLGPIPDLTFHFRGWVQSIGAEQWTIGGPPGSLMPAVVVRVTPQTRIYPDPKVDDVVLVEGIRESDGDLVATSIRKESK